MSSQIKASIDAYELNNLRAILSPLLGTEQSTSATSFFSHSMMNLEALEKEEAQRISTENTGGLGVSDSRHAAFKEDKRSRRDLWVITLNRKRWLLGSMHIASQRVAKIEKSQTSSGKKE